MLRSLKYTTGVVGPVLAFGIPVLKAESGDPQVTPRRGVKPKDLPIYPTQDVEFALQEMESNSLQEAVSVVRKQVWKVADKCQGAIDTTKKVYHFVETTTKDVVTFIKTEEGFFPRAGVISVAGLTGLVLARKGGLIRKTLYCGGMMTAATSICYPYKAVEITQAEFDWIKNKATQLYNQTTQPTTAVDKVEATKKKQDQKSGESSEIKTVDASGESTASSEKSSEGEAAPKPTIESAKDFGQSNPADKDMYTTRT